MKLLETIGLMLIAALVAIFSAYVITDIWQLYFVNIIGPLFHVDLPQLPILAVIGVILLKGMFESPKKDDINPITAIVNRVMFVLVWWGFAHAYIAILS